MALCGRNSKWETESGFLSLPRFPFCYLGEQVGWDHPIRPCPRGVPSPGAEVAQKALGQGGAVTG